MQNAAAVEALYSATFVEDYLDCVENLPNDLQRHLSRLREFDLTQYSEFLRDLDGLVTAFENEKTAAGQWQVLAKIQLGLIAAQDIGDEKMATAQALNELIEEKARLLKHDAENLDFGDESDEESKPSAATSKPAGSTTPRPDSSQATASVSSSAKTPTSTAKAKSKPSSDAAGGDKGSTASAKRRKKPDKGKGGGDQDSDHPQDKKFKGDTKSGGAGGSSKKKSLGGGGGPANSRGKPGGSKGGGGGGKVGGTHERRAAAAFASAVDNDSDEHEMAPGFDFDPDEPTYCLCEQVSFGEMVACDNDLCPFEWFHFDCVQLSSKPKGKWFCPKCRGDKPSVMKPKAQFLKELEKYNKEKEEKNSQGKR